MKSLIVYHPDEHSNLTAFFLKPIWQEYFDCAPLDNTKSYDKNSTVFWSKHSNTNDWYHQWKNSGFKIIIDHLWDNPIGVTSQQQDNIFVLQAGNWIWYNESLWYKSLGYNDYRRRPNNEKLFLMLMRQKRVHRDAILEKMQPFLRNSLYSYVDKNILLDSDIHPDHDTFQRHFNPEWYNSTAFSMCVESTVDHVGNISEKSFKPLAFQQAFLIWGEPHTLTYLKKLGFETFDHCIDETYDTILENNSRLNLIYDQVNALYDTWKEDGGLFEDATSKAKIQHNYEWFYSSDIKNKFVKDIIYPVLEFIDSSI
jgi:hypothetical protein